MQQGDTLKSANQARCLLLVLFLSLTMSFTGWAHATASIRGEVLDQTNFLVLSAKVTLKTAMSETMTSFSNDRGVYQFEKVLPGTYQVSA